MKEDRIRGRDQSSGGLLSRVDLEERVPGNHHHAPWVVREASGLVILMAENSGDMFLAVKQELQALIPEIVIGKNQKSGHDQKLNMIKYFAHGHDNVILLIVG